MRGPESQLWRAILAHALHDAAKGKDTGWIGSRDFEIVCTFAGLDPDAVRDRFKPEAYSKAIRAARVANMPRGSNQHDRASANLPTLPLSEQAAPRARGLGHQDANLHLEPPGRAARAWARPPCAASRPARPHSPR